jgi:hypothetical protein
MYTERWIQMAQIKYKNGYRWFRHKKGIDIDGLGNNKGTDTDDSTVIRHGYRWARIQ